MYIILNSISSVNLCTELATVIRVAVVVFFFLIWHPDVHNCRNNKDDDYSSNSKLKIINPRECIP